MISSLIVILSLGLGLAFGVAWFIRPDVRAGIEAPKYRFQDRVRRYDRQCRPGGDHP